VLSIGNRESSATSGYNLGFLGTIDEVQIWDRPLSFTEVYGYFNLTKSSVTVSRLDMETRTGNDLFDFGGNGHVGVTTGTKVVDGRLGFARAFAGGTDGLYLSGTATTSVSFTGGVVLSAYVLLSSYPTTDAPVIARKGDFYLNVTSTGGVSWSVYTKTTVSSPLSLPLNRWVRISVTANSAGSAILFDGVQVAFTATASAPVSASTSVTIGYGEGVAVRLVGFVDEVLVLNAVPASASTIPDLGVRGIQLNPNGADTDGDGLADGQELFVKSVKTPKRYPTRDQQFVSTDTLDPLLGAPPWAIQSIQAMVGFTHEDMGQVAAWLDRSTGGGWDRSVTLRSYGNSGQANNFTSYDLLQKPSLGGSWLVREDFFEAGRPWYIQAYDATNGKVGAIEYLQLQVTVHTLPNRADTDSDGLNDSEEINPGSDGYHTDPWKADTDGDLWSDGYETLTKGTNPLAWDTDGDGVRDSSDLDPLHNLLVAVRVDKIHHGASPWCTPELVGIVRVNDDYTWVTEHRLATEDGYYSLGCLADIWSTSVFGLTYYADVPDNVATANVRMTGWSVNPARGDDNLVDQSLTYTLNSAIPTQTFSNGNSWITFDVWTVALPKAKTLFVTDGNATITLANGQSRLVGQDRYYVLTLDVTSAYGPFVVGANTVVVPRSIFLDSKLRADFDAGTFAPLTYAPLYGENMSQSKVSESVAGTIATSLSGADAYGVAYSYVDVTSYPRGEQAAHLVSPPAPLPSPPWSLPQ